VSFTATTFHTASQQVCNTTCVKHDLYFSNGNLKKQRICIQFQFTLGKNTTERHEMFRTAFGDNVMGTTLPSGFLNLKVRKLLLQNVSIQAICQQIAQQRMWTGVSKHPKMIEALPFHGMQAGKAPCMEGACKF
jgi:hypothetical protein